MKAAHKDRSDAEVWERICLIDTENNSGSLYVGTKVGGVTIGEYLSINLEPPYSAARYLEAINAAESAGVEYLIIDSLSHAWTGVGGMLELQGNIASRSGNSYTAWREVTPQHNALIDKILQCRMHVAATMRTKVEYAIEENDRGKKTPRKIGLAPVFRDGVEYEFSTFFDIAQDHTANASKDRTGMFDRQYFLISPETGERLYQWLSSGEAPEPGQPVSIQKPSAPTDKPLVDRVHEAVKTYCAGKSQEEKEAATARIRQITGGVANYRTIKDERVLMEILSAFEEEEAL